MSRKSTGTVRILRNEQEQKAWFGKWTRANGSRSPWTEITGLPVPAREEDRPLAQAKAATLAPQIRAASEGVTPGESVNWYAHRWRKWRDTQDLGCVDGNRTSLRFHILPVIGAFDVAMLGRDPLKRLVLALDEKAKRGFHEVDGRRYSFGPKTASNVWSIVKALFRDACKCKRPDLCVRADNPTDNVAGPDTGTAKAKVYLWPSEFRTLVESERVPVRWARLFALAVYLYARAGEITALRWEDVDLVHRTIHIHRSLDRVRRKKQATSTKSDTARRVPIEPALVPLLEALKREAGERVHVFSMPSVGVLSAKLKHYLRRAGVDRADLFATDDTRKAITFHDLRATGITWMAVRGDVDSLKIMQRAGHEDFETTQIYLREAENLRSGFGEVFPALPKRLLGIAPNRPETIDDSLSGGNTKLLSGADGNRIRNWQLDKTERARGLG